MAACNLGFCLIVQSDEKMKFPLPVFSTSVVFFSSTFFQLPLRAQFAALEHIPLVK